jgi:hypothetical protein
MTHGMTNGDEGLKIGREGLKPIFDFIADAGDKPFFVWYAPFLPHTPHNPPKRLLDKYTEKTESKFIARYWAMCEWFDETCGQLLDHLDEKNCPTTPSSSTSPTTAGSSAPTTAVTPPAPSAPHTTAASAPRS